MLPSSSTTYEIEWDMIINAPSIDITWKSLTWMWNGCHWPLSLRSVHSSVEPSLTVVSILSSTNALPSMASCGGVLGI